MKRVMLYFGSFNPVHRGHIALAEYVVGQGLCDEAVLVVSPQSPYKQAAELAPEMDRFEMAEIACAASKYPDRIKPSVVEFLLPKPSYTIDTLRYLKENFGSGMQFSILMGSDQIARLAGWKEYEQILEYPVYVYPRRGEPAEGFEGRITPLTDAPLQDFASTDVRDRIGRGEDVAAMLKEDALIDLIIPRGSKEFVRYIMDNSRIPVLGHSDGICHVYVDKSADVEMAVSIAVDSKAQNVAVCNACETLLVHRDIAADFLPKLLPAMQEKHVRLLGDEATRAIIPVEAATEEDWHTEYLDYVLSIRVVDSLEAAIAHINRYGSHHTDCIVTRDDAAAKAFLTRVDSAGVYRNVSTRFADGFVYGFGAEVGIATGKLHARGPMGLDGLTTYKYKLLGDGQLMAEMKSGQRAYTHLVLHEDCPL